MAFVIGDPETDRLAREVAALRSVRPAEAVRVALERELRCDEGPGNVGHRLTSAGCPSTPAG